MRLKLTFLLALLACLAIAACGDDDDDSSSEPKKLAIDVTPAGKDRYRVSAPKTVEAGLVEITLKTPPGRNTHDAQLIRVEGNHTVDEVLEFTSAEEGTRTPPWLFAAGGVGSTKAGMTRTSTQELEPGKYFILDTDQPMGDNVKSFAETGATAEFEVTGEAGEAELPEAGSKITAKDTGKGKRKKYSFTSSGLKAGNNRIEFENTGKELHHVVAFPYSRPTTTLEEAKKAFMEEGEGSGPPPLDFENSASTTVLEGGQKQVTTLELKSGKYALVCFISDRKGGKPHVAKGMITQAVVE